ncbi:MAG: acyl carrier protein [Candidatus Komeilibacteria bacterium]|nr:acyl carrier protein [Candidatus Komeilibacteria bacterium]
MIILILARVFYETRKKPVTRWNPDELEERVYEIIMERLGVDKAQIIPQATAQDLGADHDGWLDLLIDLEEEFGLDITDEEVECLTTVQDVLSYVIAKCGQETCDCGTCHAVSGDKSFGEF